MAICGLQFVPNTNSVTGTILKNRNASNTIESTMPSVVNTATAEQPNNRTSTTRS